MAESNARDWVRPLDGTILMTGKPNVTPIPKEKLAEWEVPPADYYVPYRLPALEIDPKLKGWYRIHVGLYHGGYSSMGEMAYAPRLFAAPERRTLSRISAKHLARHEGPHRRSLLAGGEPHRQENPPRKVPAGAASQTWLHRRGQLPEAGADDRTGSRGRQQEIELPPFCATTVRLSLAPDDFFWWGTVEKEDDVRAIVYRHKQAGFGRIYWRCFSNHQDTRLDNPDSAARWSAADGPRRAGSTIARRAGWPT